ncbi:MAG: MATE family efflux transporter, partial [Bacteroidales bacterium]|nr:MATE family efflux transporter [Bacteroidales bacterium]
MNREILRIALPSIITNITVPLLGLVDIAIVGHIGEASSIGAISVGTMIFNMVYWIFNFLRFGTSGLTAQAFGRNDIAGIRKVFKMSILVALVCGVSVFILQ